MHDEKSKKLQRSIYDTRVERPMLKESSNQLFPSSENPQKGMISESQILAPNY
jgi:hypothetical protein